MDRGGVRVSRGGCTSLSDTRSHHFPVHSSETCCSTIVIPPMEWDFPTYNIHKIIGQRIRNFVANGNMLVRCVCVCVCV